MAHSSPDSKRVAGLVRINLAALAIGSLWVCETGCLSIGGKVYATPDENTRVRLESLEMRVASLEQIVSGAIPPNADPSQLPPLPPVGSPMAPQ